MGKKGGANAASAGKAAKGGGKGGAAKGGKGAAAKGGKGGASSASGAGSSDLSTCNHVKARHILCEKHSKACEAYDEMMEKYPGKKLTPGKFGEIAAKYSECSSANSGGNLGWFPRGRMVKEFEERAFGTSPGQVTGPFKTSNGYHIMLVEGRKM